MAKKWYRDDLYNGPGALPKPAQEPAVRPLTTEVNVNRVEPVERQVEATAPGITRPSSAVTIGVSPGGTKTSSTRVSKKLGDSGTFTPSDRTNYYRNYQRQLELDQPDDFSPSKDTRDYQNRLKDLEGNMPDPFESRYEGQIQSILDGILNRQSFDVKTDPNYKMLYDQMAQSYMQQGNKAMRDTIGAANAATGGYGSTYAQMAGQQAYDNYLQGLNDNNMQLMQMAYGMYADDRANDYNKMNTLQGLDNTDYGRYRDTVGDYFTNRDYFANRYDTSYNRDYGQYRDAISDWMNNRAYAADQANTAYGQDYNLFADNRNMEYQMSRDEVADRDNALNAAMKFAQAGMAVPNEFASMLGEDTVGQLNALAAQVVAQQAAGGSGGGGGRRSGSGKQKEEKATKITAEMFAQAADSRDPRVSDSVKATKGTATDRNFTEKQLKAIWNDMEPEEQQRYLWMMRQL